MNNLGKATRGIALLTVLMLMIIFLILGVSITGLATSQFRHSLKRNSEIAARQIAVAGLSKAQCLLNADWDNAGTYLGIERYYSPPGGYNSLNIVEKNNERCVLISKGYFKGPSGGPIWQKAIKATFFKMGQEFAVLALSDLRDSLEIDKSTVGGKIGTFRQSGVIRIEDVDPPPPGNEIIVTIPTSSTATVEPDIVTMERKDILPPPEYEFSISSNVDIKLSDNEEATIPPGEYRNIEVHNDSTAHFVSGQYYIRKLEVHDKSKILADISVGPVEVYIEEDFELHDESGINQGVNPADFIIYAKEGSNCHIVDSKAVFCIKGHSRIQIRKSAIDGYVTGEKADISKSDIILPTNFLINTRIVSWEEL